MICFVNCNTGTHKLLELIGNYTAHYYRWYRDIDSISCLKTISKIENVFSSILHFCIWMHTCTDSHKEHAAKYWSNLLFAIAMSWWKLNGTWLNSCAKHMYVHFVCIRKCHFVIFMNTTFWCLLLSLFAIKLCKLKFLCMFS